jgi:hypothetical protein
MDYQTSSVRDVVDVALDGSNSIHVVIGPLTWQPSDGVVAKRWYFVVATSGTEGFRCDMTTVEAEHRVEMRMQVMAEFVRRRPLVIHDVDDELEMARLCEMLWPGPRITAIRKAIEEERP